MTRSTDTPANPGTPIVAELGRPETPQETADRKAATSRKHRENQTALNLVVALGASLAIMLIIVLIVVRPEQAPPAPIDYKAIAAQAQGGIDEPLLSPDLPDDWRTNSARLGKGSDGVSTWYVGFVTPADDFVALSQGIDANATWLAAQLDNAPATGTQTIGGVRWDVYDRRDVDDPGNLEYAITTTIDASTIVLFGTAQPDEFEALAAAAVASHEGDRP